MLDILIYFSFKWHLKTIIQTKTTLYLPSYHLLEIRPKPYRLDKRGFSPRTQLRLGPDQSLRRYSLPRIHETQQPGCSVAAVVLPAAHKVQLEAEEAMEL